VSDYSNIVALLKSVGDRPIAFHTVYAHIGGSVSAGVFLSQAFYWSLRTSDPQGWFYKETKEFQEETTLTRHEQDTARIKLKKLGVLEEKRAGNHAKLHYRINFTVLAKVIAERPSKPLPEFGNGHCRNSAVTIDGKRQSVGNVSYKAQITTQRRALHEKILVVGPASDYGIRPKQKAIERDLERRKHGN
jgi:hypothetical protein